MTKRNNAALLRLSLGSNLGEFREPAARMISWTVNNFDTIRERCSYLGICRRSYERLRDEFPEAFEV